MANIIDNSSSIASDCSLDSANSGKASSRSSIPSSIRWKKSSKKSNKIIIESLYSDLYDASHAAKLWRVGTEYLQRPAGLAEFPEWVPATGENAGHYVPKPARFWTCGFFPGSLYAILERSMRYPKALPLPQDLRESFQPQFLELCRTWTRPLHESSSRTDTHDMGFIVLPALRADWELTGNRDSLASVIRGARSLATRFSSKTGAVRSWNQSLSKRYRITDMEKNFLIIIDSMCNMDLLFYAGHHTGDQTLIDKATSHAHVVRRTLVRPDSSTYHVANLDPKNGEIQYRQTHQGYSDESAWARGQAWGILGFTQTYMWTKSSIFLETAIRLADYFLKRLSESTYTCANVPLWDFRAPPNDAFPDGLRDTSAGMIAANGLLLLHQALGGRSTYLEAALRIARDTRDYSLSRDRASFDVADDGKLNVPAGRWDAILMHSTANFNEYALDHYADHGLVYADYYFLEFGNKLLRMGFT